MPQAVSRDENLVDSIDTLQELGWRYLCQCGKLVMRLQMQGEAETEREKGLRDPQTPGDMLTKIVQPRPLSSPFPHGQSRVDGVLRFDPQGV